jgi:hypothetical protein
MASCRTPITRDAEVMHGTPVHVRPSALVIRDDLQARVGTLFPEAADETEALVRWMSVTRVALESGSNKKIVDRKPPNECNVHPPADDGSRRP